MIKLATILQRVELHLSVYLSSNWVLMLLIPYAAWTIFQQLAGDQISVSS